MTLTRLMFSSLEWSLPNTWINMNMPDVWKPFNGSVSFVLLRHQTRWGLKCSTLAMGSSTLMVSTKRSACVTINARKLTTWSVLLQKKKKASSSSFIAPLMSVGSRDQVKWVTPGLKRVVKWVVKWVIFPFTVAKQKTTPTRLNVVKMADRLHQGRRPVLGKVSRSSCGLLLIWTLLLTCRKPTRTNVQRRRSPR